MRFTSPAGVCVRAARSRRWGWGRSSWWRYPRSCRRTSPAPPGCGGTWARGTGHVVMVTTRDTCRWWQHGTRVTCPPADWAASTRACRHCAAPPPWWGSGQPPCSRQSPTPLGRPGTTWAHSLLLYLPTSSSGSEEIAAFRKIRRWRWRTVFITESVFYSQCYCKFSR